MIGLGTAINIGLIIAGGLCGLAFGRFYERKFKTDAHGGERHHRATPRYEWRHAVYARYRERHAANDGAYADDY